MKQSELIKRIEKIRKKNCTCHIVGCRTCVMMDEIRALLDLPDDGLMRGK